MDRPDFLLRFGYDRIHRGILFPETEQLGSFPLADRFRIDQQQPFPQVIRAETRFILPGGFIQFPVGTDFLPGQQHIPAAGGGAFFGIGQCPAGPVLRVVAQTVEDGEPAAGIVMPFGVISFILIQQREQDGDPVFVRSGFHIQEGEHAPAVLPAVPELVRRLQAFQSRLCLCHGLRGGGGVFRIVEPGFHGIFPFPVRDLFGAGQTQTLCQQSRLKAFHLPFRGFQTVPVPVIALVCEEDTRGIVPVFCAVFCMFCVIGGPVEVAEGTEDVGQIPFGGVPERGEGAEKDIGLAFLIVGQMAEERQHAPGTAFFELEVFSPVHLIQQRLCFSGGLGNFDGGEGGMGADPAFHILLPDFDLFGIGEADPAAQGIFFDPAVLLQSGIFPHIAVRFVLVCEQTDHEVVAPLFPFVIPLTVVAVPEVSERTEDVEKVFIRCRFVLEEQRHQQAGIRGSLRADLSAFMAEEGIKVVLLLRDRQIMFGIFQVFQQRFGFSGGLRGGDHGGAGGGAEIRLPGEPAGFSLQIFLYEPERLLPLLDVFRQGEISPEDQLIRIDPLKTERGFRCHLPICFCLIVPQEADNVPEGIRLIHGELAPFPFVFPVEQPQEDTVLILCRGPDRLCAQPEKQIELVRIPERVVMEEGEQPEPALFFRGRNFIKTVLEKTVEWIGMKIFLPGLFEV